MLCLNPRCRATLTAYQWGEGYCSGECMDAHLAKGETMTQCLHSPTTGRTICQTQDEIDAFAEAHLIDARLPRIIYLRRACLTYRGIASRLNVAETTVRKIYAKCGRKLLRRCGLRRK